MISKIDLHTHSTASDGTMPPAELAYYAKEKGITSIALTDHDTVSGAEEFLNACGEVGIEGISGVEISAKYRCEMHIVGLFTDHNDSEFKNKLSKLKNARYDRNKKMLEKINEAGMELSVSDITGQKDGGSLGNTGRAHMAYAMVNKGYVKTAQEAFDKYLGKGMECYVPRLTYPPKESIELIKNAGGLAVLAHPIYITKDESELYNILSELKEYGLTGAECYYSEYDRAYMELCLRVCKRLDLLPSGGSDFHAGNKPHIELGVVCGDMSIPYSVLENLKKRKEV